MFYLLVRLVKDSQIGGLIVHASNEGSTQCQRLHVAKVHLLLHVLHVGNCLVIKGSQLVIFGTAIRPIEALTCNRVFLLILGFHDLLINLSLFDILEDVFLRGRVNVEV